MTGLVLADAAGVTDLATFLSRASALDPGGAVRLQAGGSTLAAYVQVLEGQGLLGSGAVLGLRVCRLGEPADLDVLVPIADLAGRLAGHQDSREVDVPPSAAAAGWAAIAPPRGGWEPVGTVDRASLRAAARRGIEEIATGSPPDAGAHAVRALRRRVWARETGTVPPVPAGGAFAAYALGFLTEDVRVLANGRWTRLSTASGHVLLR